MSTPNPQGKAVIFSAPSGAGKTTIVHHLLQSDLKLAFSISATSRPPRPVERDGKDYYYLTPELFKLRIDRGDFLEWEEVYQDQFYGTLHSEVERIWSEGNHVIFDVDVVGGLNIKKHFGDQALAVFVKAPSIDALRHRLEGRSTETPEKIEKRMAKATQEMGFAEHFDHVLINDDLPTALEEARKVVTEFLDA